MLVVAQDILVFVLTQETMVDEDTCEVLADRLVEEDCRHRGVDTAREGQDDLVITQLSTKLSHGALNERGWRPVATDTRYLEEVIKDLETFFRVECFGMELNPPRTLAINTEGCCLYVLGAGDDTEALRERGDGITVGHPDDTARCDTLEELIILVA